MTLEARKNESRREFFRTLLRSFALGGLAGGAGLALTRKRDRSPLSCVNDRNCRTCERCCRCPLSRYESPDCGPECSDCD